MLSRTCTPWGRTLTALAIAGFPGDADRTLVSAIFRGGLDLLNEAGVALLGGHTVQDQEIKFGYAVTGEVHPRRIWSNAGARPGDRLILTKPLGTGVIATAIKFGRAPAGVAAAAIASMTQLNRDAAGALAGLPDGALHACTDITGFGLIGHASEMAVASGVTLSIDAGAVPLLDGALELVDRNTPGGGRTNRQYFEAAVTAAPSLDPRCIQLLYDPQTSGGLLAAVDATAAEAALAALVARSIPARLIGSVETAQTDGRVGEGGGRPVAVHLR